ncbi:MAG: GNAT family N-acetyltransferase [Cyclobacteriaceae bacterium]
MTSILKDIDTNFHLHACKIPDQTAGMKVTHLENLTYVDSGLSCDTFNIIHIIRGSKLTKEEVTDAVGYFRQRNLAFCVWASKENLTNNVKHYFEDLSLSKQNEEIGMVLDLEVRQPMERKSNNNIVIVDSKKLTLDYAQVIAKNWTPSDKNVLKYYEMTCHSYLNKSNKIWLLVYYHKGQPVSTVELFPTDDRTIGLYGFATLSAYRGRGIGSSLMTFALSKVKELGYLQAILQASGDGIGIYRKFGFKDQISYFEYV